jgi:flagellar biosynthesis/type III secretory pathway M-ring protein FliF/YscJ
MSNTIWLIIIILVTAAFAVLMLLDRPSRERRRDDRDAKKAAELTRNPAAETHNQQAAELQVGEDEEFRRRERFELDAKGNNN